MFDRLNLKDEYVTVVADDRIIVSHYNEPIKKIVDYYCNRDLTKSSVMVLTLKEAAEGKTIRFDEKKNRLNPDSILSVNPKWFVDKELAVKLLTHLEKVENLKVELSDILIQCK